MDFPPVRRSWKVASFFLLLSSLIMATIIGRTEAATETCPATTKNSAFVFIKPHANTEGVRDLVMEKLKSSGINILKVVDIGGEEIDQKNLIDQHYYSIASKATILPANKIPVPIEKFEKNFGESWTKVLSDGRAVNALEACKRFECSPDELNKAWNGVSDSTVKLGGGFYCAKMSVNGKSELYVFNAFFMTMRSKYVGKDKEIRCYEVEWDPTKLSWSSFRNDILGPTDPNEAPPNSIRKTILDQYKKLGLSSIPDRSDNGVHASASPFEALAEKMNWLKMDLESDGFGKALVDAGISKSRIHEWSRDPQINLSVSATGSVFDALEDLDIEDCIQKLIELNKLN